MDCQDDTPDQIQTFVFLDLETTGIFDRPRILELSMLAVSRKDLLLMKDKKELTKPRTTGPPPVPRVLHKYTRLYYPKKLIHPEVERITDLSNENLHCLSSFNIESASAIKSFLTLPPPVCLVAHNGASFDFPILKAELVHADLDNLYNLNGIVCADSLRFARHNESEDIKLLTELAKDFKNSDFEELDHSRLTSSNSDIIQSSLPQNDANCSHITLIEGSQLDVLKSNREIYKTPEKQLYASSLNSIPRTPQRNSTAFTKNEIVTPELSPKENGCKFNGTSDTHSKAKRTLYYNEERGQNVMKQPFKQTNLYYRLFRESYVAHRAEADAQALLQICSYFGESFVNWADKHSSLFQSVAPKWTIRRSFTI